MIMTSTMSKSDSNSAENADFQKLLGISEEKQHSSSKRGSSEDSLFDFSHIASDVRLHLTKVYLCLTTLIAVASYGCYLQQTTDISQWLASALMVCSFCGILFSKGSSKLLRMTLLLTFGFFTGIMLGDVVGTAADIDPQLVLTAFMATCSIFACFTIASLLCKERSALYLGSTLSTALIVLSLIGAVNMVTDIPLLHSVYLYVGLVVFTAYIVYDTQMIVQKAERGDKDFAAHTVDLFLDFVSVFVRILVLLTEKKSSSRKKSKNE